jgi:hypothetical protein
MKALGEAGAGDVTLGGNGPLPGARKRDRRPDAVARRAASFVDTYAPTQEYDKRGKHLGGTLPLNAGFFKLERMRAATITRKRGAARAKARGK